MEILWSTTISEEDLREWGKTKFSSWKKCEEEYFSKNKAQLEEAKTISKLEVVLDDIAYLILKDYLCDMVDDSIVEVKEISFKKEYNAYLVTYSKEAQ